MRDPSGLRRLRADVEDEPITLHAIDLLDFDDAGEDLRANVNSDGVVLYERPPRTKANFLKAHDKLVAFAARDNSDELVRTAVIQAFEYTFETAWQLIRSAVEAEGITSVGPRQALREGITLGFLATADETAWLDMLSDRNLSVYTYDETLAVQLMFRIQSSYIPVFARLRTAASTAPAG